MAAPGSVGAAFAEHSRAAPDLARISHHGAGRAGLQPRPSGSPLRASKRGEKSGPGELVGAASLAKTAGSALRGVPIPRKNAAADVIFEEGPKRGVEVGANGNVTTPALVMGDKFFQHLFL